MPGHTHNIWFFYLLGFVGTLMFKLAKAIYLGRKEGKNIRKVSLDWFFCPTLENASSWTATIGGVWVIGSIYINRIVSIAGLTDLPVHASIAFLLGAIFEVTVPNIVKWITSKIPVK